MTIAETKRTKQRRLNRKPGGMAAPSLGLAAVGGHYLINGGNVEWTGRRLPIWFEVRHSITHGSLNGTTAISSSRARHWMRP
jgi:hypothetical protein